MPRSLSAGVAGVRRTASAGHDAAPPEPAGHSPRRRIVTGSLKLTRAAFRRNDLLRMTRGFFLICLRSCFEISAFCALRSSLRSHPGERSEDHRYGRGHRHDTKYAPSQGHVTPPPGGSVEDPPSERQSADKASLEMNNLPQATGYPHRILERPYTQAPDSNSLMLSSAFR